MIIEKLDRLSRALMVQESIIRDFMSHGFNLISALDGPDLLSGDPTRKFIRHMFGAIAHPLCMALNFLNNESDDSRIVALE
ncbi:MAG: recombinase family protein [Syntrophobacteraceae bacterium]|nr:recombinase family protein [Syntrophobacteraceae bacterium]